MKMASNICECQTLAVIFQKKFLLRSSITIRLVE
jgi:hypothetical protein